MACRTTWRRGWKRRCCDAQRDLLEIVPWEETEDPAAKVAAVAGPAAEGAIAAGDELWSVFTIRLQGRMPRARWTEGGQLLRPLRMIKDEREIALLAEAARRTDESWEEFLTTSITGLDRVGGARAADGAPLGAGAVAGLLQRRQRTERRLPAPDGERPRRRPRRRRRLRLGRLAGGLQLRRDPHRPRRRALPGVRPRLRGGARRQPGRARRGAPRRPLPGSRPRRARPC